MAESVAEIKIKKDTKYAGKVLRVKAIEKNGVIRPDFDCEYEMFMVYDKQKNEFEVTVSVPVEKNEKEKFDKLILDKKTGIIKTVDISRVE